MSTNVNHIQQHTRWYKIKRAVKSLAFVVAILCPPLFLVSTVWVLNKDKAESKMWIDRPITIEVNSRHTFHPSDGVQYKEIKNVGLTYYCRGDGYTPGTTTRSGRFVYDGAIAVSQPLWGKEVFPGDLIYVKATKRWYKAEDTMHEKYKDPRVDIYTHNMSLAKSGSHKTDIIIVRQPK